MRSTFLLISILPVLLLGAPTVSASGPGAEGATPLPGAVGELPAPEPSPGDLPGEVVPDTPGEDLPAAEMSASALPAEPEDLPDPNVQRAERALLVAEEEEGADAASLAAPLRALALAQLEAGQHAAAAATLQREVVLLEKHYGVYDRRIAEPLSLLGEVQITSGQYEDSIETFQRAQHLVHRADGVYSLDQLDYLEKMSRSFIEMNKYGEADRHNRLSFFVSENRYGPESPELVPAMLKLADWTRRAGNIRDARKLYERAVRVIENAQGMQHPSLIEPLMGLATTTRKKGQYRKERERALKRMVAIVDSNPDLDTVDRAAAWASLGDFYVMINRQSLAADAYNKGYALLHADTSLPEGQLGFFSEPRILNFPKRIYLMDHTPGTPLTGFDMSLVEFSMEVEFEVDIGADGRVLSTRMIDIDASPSTRRQIRRYVREARFRPRIVDGKPLRTDAFRMKEKLTIVRPRG